MLGKLLENKKTTVAVSGVAALAAAYGYDPETVVHLGGAALSHQFTQTMLLFTAAAFIHSTNVKQGIKEAVANAVTELVARFEGRVDALSQAMTKSIDRITTTLKQDIDAHTARLDGIDKTVAELQAKPKEET